MSWGHHILALGIGVTAFIIGFICFAIRGDRRE